MKPNLKPARMTKFQKIHGSIFLWGSSKHSRVQKGTFTTKKMSPDLQKNKETIFLITKMNFVLRWLYEIKIIINMLFSKILNRKKKNQPVSFYGPLWCGSAHLCRSLSAHQRTHISFWVISIAKNMGWLLGCLAQFYTVEFVPLLFFPTSFTVHTISISTTYKGTKCRWKIESIPSIRMYHTVQNHLISLPLFSPQQNNPTDYSYRATG
jgi:hypothetical protein